MPMIGFSKSPSPKPTARNMARLGERWTPAVMAAERSMEARGTPESNLPIRRKRVQGGRRQAVGTAGNWDRSLPSGLLPELGRWLCGGRQLSCRG